MEFVRQSDTVIKLRDEDKYLITIFKKDGRWFAAFHYVVYDTLELDVKTIEEAQWKATLHLFNAINKQISRLVYKRNRLPDIRKLKSAAKRSVSSEVRAVAL